MRKVLAKDLKKGDRFIVDGEVKQAVSVSKNSGDGKVVIHIGERVIVRGSFEVVIVEDVKLE